MILRLPPRAALLALVLACPAFPQSVIVVDAAGGAGSHFRELPPAILAARRGDTVLVRAGTYATEFGVRDGLTLLGMPGAMLEGSMVVADLVPGQSFTMRGFGIARNDLYLLVADCEGLVSLQDLGAPLTGPSTGQLILAVRTSRAVELKHVHAGRLDAFDTELVIASSVLECTELRPVGLVRGKYTIVDSTVIGAPHRSAVSVSGDLTITRSLITARLSWSMPAAAISAYSATIHLDPTAVLVASDPSVPPIVGSGSVVPRQVVSCLAREGSNHAHVDLHGPALASYALLASVAATPVSTPFGSLWLDPASTVVVASGTLGSARGGTHFLALPSMFPGSEFVMQAVVLQPSAVELSSPSVVVTR